MAAVADVPPNQPNHICETNYDIFQHELPHAIKLCSKFPASHPQKKDRLEYIEHLILSGADPLKVMDLHGEETTPLQRALEYGDRQTLVVVREAMQKFAQQAHPIIVYRDPDAFFEDESHRKLPVALIFPGMSSAYVGMLKEVQDLEPCQLLLEKARNILGYDVLSLCLEGPEDRLMETKFGQPSLFVANACAVEKLRLEKPEVVARAQAAAGLDVGELNACVFSGMMDFELGLRMVRARADALHAEAKKQSQGAVNIAGLELAVVQRLCEEAEKQATSTAPPGQEEVCKVSVHLFPMGYACSGTTKALELLQAAAEREGALQVRPQRTAAFQTPLMAPASVKVNRALKANVTNMTFPKVDLYMNATGRYQRAGTDPREINMDLTTTVSSPVLWHQSIEEMLRQGITEFYECGPMKQLKSMMRRVSQDAWENTRNVSV